MLEFSPCMSPGLATVANFGAWRSNPTYSGFKAADTILGNYHTTAYSDDISEKGLERLNVLRQHGITEYE